MFPKTEKEFLEGELKEEGFDFVDAQFLLGYVPTFINGVWLWRKKPAESVTPAISNTSTIPHTPVNLVVELN